jgi:hypothetical protein
MQIHIWELANEYRMDAEDVRRALSIAGLHRPSIISLVPDAQARRILGDRNRGRKSDISGRDRARHPDALSEAAAIFDVDERSLKARRDAGMPKRQPARSRREPKRELTEWDRNFIEPADAIEWRDNGVYDVDVALKAMQLGLGPGDMKIKLGGVPVWQRLANGESVASLKSRLRELGEQTS